MRGGRRYSTLCRQVEYLMDEGYSQRAIAEMLGISMSHAETLMVDIRVQRQRRQAESDPEMQRLEARIREEAAMHPCRCWTLRPIDMSLMEHGWTMSKAWGEAPVLTPPQTAREDAS